MKSNISQIVLGLFLMVIFLMPFSRYSELPILILTIMGLVGLVKHKNNLFNNKTFKILTVVFLCYFCMILFSATDSYWQSKTLLVGLASVRFYLSTIALLLYIESRHLHWLIKGMALIITFWSFDAIFQYFIGFDLIGRSSYVGRLNGIFGESHAKLGPVLALFLPAVMIALKNHKPIIRWLVTLAIIITIILSGTRSAWIMVLFTLVAYWFHHVKQRRLILLIKSGLVTVVLLTGLWIISPEFQKRIERSATVFDGSKAGLDFALADRLPIWSASIAMIQEHPINGVGAHAFRKAYPKFANDGDKFQKDGGVGMHAHHWLLEILSDTGILGLLLFIFACIKLIKFNKVHYAGDYSWVFVIALFSAFLPITSTYSIFASFWSICIWFCGAGYLVMSQKNE